MTTATYRSSESAWWETPLQTRNEHFGSFVSADFPEMSARQPEWRLSPLERFAPLVSGQIDGGRYSASVTNAELAWVPINEVKSESPAPEDILGAIAWESTTEALVVTVSGEGEPAVLSREIDGIRAAHLVVRFAPNTHRTLIIENSGDCSLTENVVIVVGDGSRASVVHLGEWADTTTHNAAHTATLGKSAHLDHILVSLSGSVQRVNPSLLLAGTGSSVYSAGACFADAGRHVEHRVFVHHIAPNTESDVLYKGALHGKGTRTVWVGDVLIGRDASGTKSYEANRNLVLSDGARADSIPNLEIETGEIEGAGHASATGRLDNEHLFYLQSRGISENEARRLVALGFLLDVIGKIGVATLEERLTERIAESLDALEADR